MSVTVTAVAALAHGAVLAAGKVPVDNVTPGVLGFLVVAGMGIILYFLLRSMNRQLRKIPPPPRRTPGMTRPRPGSTCPRPRPVTGPGDPHLPGDLNLIHQQRLPGKRAASPGWGARVKHSVSYR